MANNSACTFRIALFGDSICFGQGVALHRTWAVRLSQYLGNELAPAGIAASLINPSINGDTTRRALERMPFDIQTRAIDAILIQFGLNDANCWESDAGLPRVSEDAFAANLREMIARARRFGARVVILNTNHPTTRTHDTMPSAQKTFEASNQQYNQIIRSVAKHDGQVVLNDIGEHFDTLLSRGGGDLAEMLLADGLHLSERGHDAYFDFLSARVASAIRAAARDLKPE